MGAKKLSYQAHLLATRDADYILETLHDLDWSATPDVPGILLKRAKEEAKLRKAIGSALTYAFDRFEPELRDGILLQAVDLGLKEIASEILRLRRYQPKPRTLKKIAELMPELQLVKKK